MKALCFMLSVILCSCALNENDAKLSGNLNYTKQGKQSSATNKLGLEFKKPIYEPQDKKQLYYVGGSVYHNYDLFGKTYHLNGFGQLGMEF